MATINGDTTNNDLFGTASDDVLNGGDGNDTLTGFTGNDTLNGGTGADVLVGGAGNDILDGGAGAGDRILYYRENGTNGIVADLDAGTIRDTYGDTDQVTGIEQIYGSDNNDTISGRTAAGDLLFGREGNDSINGGGGNDTLVGDSGNDTIIGGGGDDQVAYFLETGTQAVHVDLEAGTATDTFGNTDTLVDVDRVYGTARDDTLLGANLVNDLLFGREGNDSINGRSGNDILVGGQGNDTLNGGVGDDQVAYFLETGTQAVHVDLETGVATDTFGDTDMLIGIDRVYGAGGDDTIFGAEGTRDLLYGRSGNDTLNGRGSNDTLVGDAGNDTLNGGDGNDQVAYFLETGTQGVTVDLRAGTATDTFGNTDTLISIEYAFGSNADDVLLGTDEDGDRLFGRDGNDTIDARDGDNLIFTGAGDDLIRVGTTTFDARDTVVINGNGNKTITGFGSEGTRFGHHIVFEVDAALTVNLATGIATTVNMTTDFSQALHFLEVGGSAYDDRITGGNTLHDELEWYVGHQGNDTIDGGSGTGDTIVYDDEVIFGQFNYDRGVQEFGSQGAVVNLQTGVATDTFGFTDTLINIDQIRGTSYSDTVIGSDEDNGFWMLGGNDVIDGGAGFDRVHYDDDTMHGGNGAAYVNLVTGRAIDGYGGEDQLSNIEGVFTTGQNDTVIGSAADNRIFTFAGDDTATGGAGSDVILGHEGNDTLRGETGDDEIWGGAGNDIVDGGAGIDVARYRDATGQVIANLATGVVQDGYGTTDTLIDIENVHTSEQGDQVTGSSGANQIFGYGGNDTLNGADGADVILGGTGNDQVLGGAGDDELRGEAGNDTLNGGAGTDVARYLQATSGVTVDMISGSALDGYGTLDTLISIENVHGSNHGDRVTGNIEANQIFGFGGADTLLGGSGNDSILGGDGNDSLNGGANNDELRGEAGNDTLNGGAGSDIARYLDAAAGINANLTTNQVADGDGGIDTLIDIENVHGSRHNDTVQGNAGANLFSGFGGADLLMGADGADTLLGGDGNDNLLGGNNDDEIWGDAGDDTLNGGSGSDLARYRNDASGITANLSTNVVADGFGGTDQLISIEHLHGSDHGDTITGNAEANRLFGFDGADTLNGEAGADVLLGGNENDSINGGAGNDEIWGEGGNDTLNGGSGNDLARYIAATSAVSVDLNAGTASDGQGGTDVLISIESVHTSDYDDIVVGNDVANSIFGFAGDDTLSGMGDADTLLGGTGDDSINGGDGNDEIWGQSGTDTLDGGAGSDVVRYRNTTEAVSVNLIAGLAFDGYGYTDTLINIEHVHGSDHNDLLIGDDSGNQLFGYEGADTIQGGRGADTLSGGQGGDTYVYVGGDNYDVINDLGGTGTDTVIVQGYLSQNAAIFQQGNNIVLDFGNGTASGLNRDVLVLANTMSAGSTSAIEQIIFGNGEVWTLSTLISNIGQSAVFASTSASGGDDALWGTNESDVINALGGDDIVSALAGHDTIDGGAGNDTLRGGDGDDRIMGGAGNDALYGEEGADVFVLHTGMGQDTIYDFAFGTDALDRSGLSGIVESDDGSGNRVVTLSDGSSVTLLGVSATGSPVPTVTITGATSEDAILQAEVTGLVSLYGAAPSDITYQWLRDGVAILDATATAYQLVQADVGHSISVRVTYDGTSITGTTTDVIENVNDRPTGTLAVTGTPAENSILTADTSTLSDADGLGTFTYQWLLNGVAIAGATQASYQLTQQDVSGLVTVQVTYTDGQGTVEQVLSPRSGPVVNVNDAPTGIAQLNGIAVEGNTMNVTTDTLADADGLGAFSYQWLRDGVAISGATESAYTLVGDDVGAAVSVRVIYTDGQGTVETVTSDSSSSVLQGTLNLIGTSTDDVLTGGEGDDNLSGLAGNDRLIGNEGHDTLNGGDGADTLNGGDGNDVIFGGSTDADLRDIVYAGAGNDSVNGGYGNDQLNGGDGNDSMEGGFGVDTIIGQGGDDVLTGSAFSDLIFGGAGDDFVNGGFGSDRVNGGEGADRFFHLGIADHGNDWIQDYDASEGDVLHYANRVTRDQFQINTTNTANAGSDDVDEAFIIYRPTGQILWALVDGAGQDEINIRLGSEVFDLLG
ncbi:calcium-binding protein [Tateyamaria sp. ANG-S1]|uniref:calcium-binding protein n=1 Tax=Tateyamaria sp. ANG-S1 TaxID=1577905 RepID=UPI00057C4888|nr:calcium-binding protein [Tateyamaria sp. ANG-S1]KIC47790.1 hypothetical protein RA29_18940 [Tateyamaria sp. ANG-S1]